MGLYNFQNRFVPFILDGRKTHTIRAIRQHPDKPGNTLHLYTGLRLKRINGKSRAKLLMRVPCVKVERIEICAMPHATSAGAFKEVVTVEIDGQFLDGSEKEALARRDGFRDFEEMMNFWDGRLPFQGHVIHWKNNG